MKYCPLCERTYDDEVLICEADSATLRHDAARPDPLIGQVLKGRYRVTKRLGQGGMGRVYLADQLNLGKRVALKILHAEFAEDREFVKRFRQEAKAAAAISAKHRNVVTVYDFDQAEDGQLFIAMEYIEGQSLNELIGRESALDVRRALRLGIEIAEALAAAHQAGVIHRDIKPQNIMIGFDDSVHLMDFGIARMRETDSGTRLTRAGVMMGTPEYLSLIHI